MRTIDLNVTQGIHGFQAERTAYLEGPEGGRDAHVRLSRAGFRCPCCGQAGVAVYGEREREIGAQDLLEKMLARRSLPSPIRGGVPAEGRQDYAAMSSAEFAALKKRLARAAQSARTGAPQF